MSSYISPRKIMVIIVMFDLPTGTKKQRRSAAVFRKHLLTIGFDMMQYSIYYRYCIGDYSTRKYVKSVEAYLPKKSGGSIRLLKITSKQFDDMKIYYSSDRKKQVKKIKTEQLLLF